MLLQIQFPIADLRILADKQTSRLKVPSFPAPLRDEEFMRSTGIIRKRPHGGLSGWIAEESYCDARHAITLDPERTTRVLARWKLRIAFRRFYFDGTAVAKFEIGFTNRHDCDLTAGDLNDLLADIMTMPVRIGGAPSGARLCRLVDAGKPLAAAYTRASTRHPSGWLSRLIKSRGASALVVAGTPAIFIECFNYPELQLPRPTRAIDTSNEALGLSLSRHAFEGRAFPVWTATHPDFEYPRPLYRASRARQLRLYLLRLNAESQTFVRVLKALNANQIDPTPRSPQSDLLQAYLLKATSNIIDLSEKSRPFAQGDDKLLALATAAAESFLSPEERQSALSQLQSLDIRKNIFRKVEDQPSVSGRGSEVQLPQIVVINGPVEQLNVGGVVMSKNAEKLIAVLFGAAFLIALLVLAIVFPIPTAFQYTVFRIVLSVAAAGFVSMTPGFLELTINNWLRAGGALAVFAVVYFFSPAALVANPT